MPLLSALAELRTVLVLIILWQALRIWQRYQQNARDATSDGRSRGEVRIERTDRAQHPMDAGHVEDAEFEEIN